MMHRRSFPASAEEMRAALQLLPQHLLESTGIREAVLQPGVAPEALVRKHTLSENSLAADSRLAPLASPLFAKPHGRAASVRRVRSNTKNAKTPTTTTTPTATTTPTTSDAAAARGARGASAARRCEESLPPSVETVLQQNALLRRVLSRMRAEEMQRSLPTTAAGPLDEEPSGNVSANCVYCAGHLLVAGRLCLEAHSLLFSEGRFLPTDSHRGESCFRCRCFVCGL